MGRNAQGFFLRTRCKCSLCKTIKSPVENMKSKAKKDVAHDKKERRKTGEGPQNVISDEMSNRISALIPHQMHSLHNSFDDEVCNIQESKLYRFVFLFFGVSLALIHALVIK